MEPGLPRAAGGLLAREHRLQKRMSQRHSFIVWASLHSPWFDIRRCANVQQLLLVAVGEEGAGTAMPDGASLPRSFDGEFGVQHGAPQQAEVAAQNPKVRSSQHHTVAELSCFNTNR